MDTYIDWIHPSVRDVVIEHLASGHEDRQRFLRTTNEAGIALALSIGGGVEGERVRPLLQTPGDWAIVMDRILEIVTQGNISSHTGLMRRISDALEVEQPSGSNLDQLRSTATTLIDAVTTEWDRRNTAVPPSAWEVFFSLQIDAGVWSPAPNPKRSWDHIVNLAQSLSAEDDLTPFTDLAKLCRVLERFERRFLRIVNYPACLSELAEEVDLEISSRVKQMPNLADEEDVEAVFDDGHTETMPVEPDSAELDDREWLGEADDLLDVLRTLEFVMTPSTLECAESIRDGFATRTERKERFDNFDPDRGDWDYSSDSRRTADTFSIDAFFADL